MASRAAMVAAVVLLPALLCGAANPAAATPVTRSFTFEATDLRSQIFDQGVFPVTDPVFGTVTVVIDPQGAPLVDVMAPDGSVNVTADGPIGYSYLPDTDELAVGGLGSGVEGSGIADFILRIGDASTSRPTFLGLSYNESREFWIAQEGSVALIGVPEPATPALFGLAALMLAAAGALTPSRRNVPAGSR